MWPELRRRLEGSRGRPLFIDANLLVLLLVGAIDKALVSRFKRTRRYGPEDFVLLEEVMGFCRPSAVCASAHVLAEANNLLRNLDDPHRSKTVPDVFEQFLRGAVELRDRSALSLVASTHFPRLGLTDAGLIEYCRAANAVLLTDDLDLFVAASTDGLTALNFSHIRELAP